MDFNPELAYDLLKKDLDLRIASLDDALSIGEARSFSLLNSLFKKWEPTDPSSLDDVTINAFLQANSKCRYLPPEFPDRKSPLHIYIDQAKSLIFEALDGNRGNSLTLDDILQGGRAGPGASVATKHTDFYQKMFCGPLSYTDERLYGHYLRQVSERWRAAEYTRRASHESVLVEGSKLSTVPKSSKTNRTICTEPSLNMFYQLGAGAIIESALKRCHNIDLSLQPDRNRWYARRGSVDGSFATIDLSAASDTISTRLVKYLLPKGAFASLDFIRSKQTSYKGMAISLDMFSSMGNGFTFPLQTLIFASLVRAVYIIDGISIYEDGKPTYSVFGDDIICTSHAYDKVTAVLEFAGFTVNFEKSYNSGSFRESCGSDWFKGHDIRGVYLKHIRSEGDLYSAFNRLARWSAKSWIPLPLTLQYLRNLVSMRPVPLHAGDSEGIKIPLSLTRCVKRDTNGSYLYRPLVVSPRQLRITDGNCMNCDGAIISAIAGFIREHRIGLRINQPKLKVVRRKTPSWDYLPDPGLTTRDLEQALLECKL